MANRLASEFLANRLQRAQARSENLLSIGSLSDFMRVSNEVTWLKRSIYALENGALPLSTIKFSQKNG